MGNTVPSAVLGTILFRDPSTFAQRLLARRAEPGRAGQLVHFSTFDTAMSTITDIQEILAARNLAAFVGRPEDTWFDAKAAAGYDLNTAAGRWELAKDISSFANAEGGFVIVGLTTEKRPEIQPDCVGALDLMPMAAFNAGHIVGVLGDHLYPALDDLEVTWIESDAAEGQGVGVIYIPARPPDRRFTLIGRVLDEGEPIKSIAFGYAIRRGDASVPQTVADMFRMCQNGRTAIAERLLRIEEKLDHLSQLLLNGPQTQAAPPADAEEIHRRIERIIHE